MASPATSLPVSFLSRPIAHRAYHDAATGRPENSMAAASAAVERGYGIEIDLQLSKDNQAMVFHDYDLGRLTKASGPIRQRSSDELCNMTLRDGSEGIPLFRELLKFVAGRVPILVELKDQDGAMGPNVGILEHAVAEALDGYVGDVAIMSFNPHSALYFAGLSTGRAVGLTTDRFDAENWGLLPDVTRKRLREIPDFDTTWTSFISHSVKDLDNPAVMELKSQGIPILCWTIRSAATEAEARKVADNITFEGYAA